MVGRVEGVIHTEVLSCRFCMRAANTVESRNKEIARLREALEFYCDADEDDGGKKAREALGE